MRTAPALLIVLAATLALTACAPDDGPPVVDPEPTVTPIFESDEEALAAAEAAYAEYLAVSNLVLSEGGAMPERVVPFLADSYKSQPLEAIAIFAERGWRTSGSAVFSSVQLQQYFDDRKGVAEIVIYGCLDLSGSRVLDESGQDVTPDRDELVPLEVSFINVAEYSTELVQSGSEVWSGEDFCG